MDNRSVTLDNTPKLLRPWSIIDDDELTRLRTFEMIARSRIMHTLRDPSVSGLSVDGPRGTVSFTRDELEELIGR